MLESLSRIDDVIVTALEHAIDRHQELLPPLTRFVLPGGSLLAAHLHLARTICRRAERRVTPLVELEGVEPRLVRYLNRLADLLFVLARAANHRAGEPEVTWPAGSGA